MADTETTQAQTAPAAPVYKKNVFDNPKLSLRAPNAKGKIASLVWGLSLNNPRITVYTNDPDDTVDGGRISANMDAPTFFALLKLISRAITSDSYFKDKVENKNHPRGTDGARSDTSVVVSNTIVERDNDGVISVSVVAPSRPIVKFVFGPSEYHNFIHKDGTPWSRAELSVIYAESYLTMLTTLMTAAMNSNYVEPVKRERPAGGGFQRNGGGGGGNRGNWNGGNKGGFNRGGGGGNWNGGGGNYNRGGNGGGNWNNNRNQAPQESRQPSTSETPETFDDWPT